MAKRRIDPRKFVEAWQTSSSAQEVAEKTGLAAKTCTSRASYYRKKGVPLKHMKPHSRADWDQLAEYARTFEQKEGESE